MTRAKLIYKLFLYGALLAFTVFAILYYTGNTKLTGFFLIAGFIGLAPAIFGPMMNITGSSLASWWREKNHMLIDSNDLNQFKIF
jgi:hypothetical protein